ncbi:MAG: hypothetical protein N3J91_09615 [Verrucomicrobiae bacterium]|nr:hypothetical protein [Verrucomicrobiae bacterium]
MNAWETSRGGGTQSELVYWGWTVANIPVMALDPDQLWEYDPATPLYYLDWHRDLPPEITAVVHQAAAAIAAKGSATSASR